MNPVDYALNEVKRKIPKEILNACFIETRGFGELAHAMPVSIDYRIREDVLDARVLVDTNLVGGQDTHISLEGIPPEYLPSNKTMWRIPLSRTDNKHITSVDSVIQSTMYNGVTASIRPVVSGSMVDASRGLYTSSNTIPVISSEQIRLVGENTVVADELYPYTPGLVLKCTLENDREMNNLPRKSYPKFSKLVTLAVKSHIYNELYIMMSATQIVAGQELGAFGTILESYADAEDMYEEYLTTTWSRVAILSDPESKRRHLEMLISRQ